MKPVVGVIGVGKMGSPMTRHLLNAGYEVYVLDLDLEKVNELLKIGAKQAETPFDMAMRTDMQIIMVGYDPEVREIVFGEQGLLAARKKGSVIAIAITAKPQTIREIGEKAAQYDVDVLDAPVCRGAGRRSKVPS